MIKPIFIILLFFTFSSANPYKDISIQEQLNLFTNHFLNESIKAKLPKLPAIGEPQDHDYNYKPTKYELYYNYVQRIKAIQDSIAEEKEELKEKYKADIYKYNKKISLLSKFYSKEQNLYPIVSESFNKALKVVYGKPLLAIKSGEFGIQFFLTIQSIYNENKFTPLPIEFNYTEEKKLFKFYEKCDISVTFEYTNNLLSFDEVVCSYQDNIYQGKINSENSEKIKLNVKINDDIFQQIKIPNGDKTNE